MRKTAAHASIHECLDGPIVDAEGEPAGEICDLLLDCRSGRIDFVRVAITPAGSADRRYITIPWSALQSPRDDDRRWGVRVQRRTLEKMARRQVRF